MQSAKEEFDLRYRSKTRRIDIGITDNFCSIFEIAINQFIVTSSTFQDNDIWTLRWMNIFYWL